MQIEIPCPVHGTIETIELPDNYRDFHGEILCSTPMARAGLGARLGVSIVDGKLISVERAGGAPRPFEPPTA